MSIRMKNGRPYVQVYDPALGENRHVKPADHGMNFRGLTGRALMRAARELEQRALDAIENPGREAGETVADFIDRWTRDYRGSSGRPRSEATLIGHAQAVSWLRRDFGDRLLDGGIDRTEARAWAQQHPHRLPSVRLMFNDAVDDRLAGDNPFARLGVAQSVGRRDLVVLTADEVTALADLALKVIPGSYGQQARSLILWAAYTCMRPGEIYAARWSRLDGDTYDVREQFNARTRRETEPKHGSSGLVYVPVPALDAVRQLPRRLDDDLIYRTVRGKQLRHASWHHVWNPIRRAFTASLPASHDLRRRLAADERDQLDLYELRHFGATYMLNELHIEPWKIAQQLRHSDDGTLVVKLYGHPKRMTAIDSIRSSFGGNVAPLREVSGESRGKSA